MKRPVPSSLRGVAVVEMAIVLTLLSTLVFGTIEIGRALYHYDTLTKSVRAAARYLVVNRPKENAEVPNWKRAGECLAVYGKPDCTASDSPLLTGLKTSHVSIREPSTDSSMKDIQTGQGMLDILSVSIEGYKFTSVISFVVPDITFGGITAVMPYVYF